MFGFHFFQYFSSFLNLSKLYGQVLPFLDHFLPKNDKIWILLFTFHSQHLNVLTYFSYLFFKISGGEKRGRWRTWEQRYTEIFKILSLTLHRKDNNRLLLTDFPWGNTKRNDWNKLPLLQTLAIAIKFSLVYFLLH